MKKRRGREEREVVPRRGVRSQTVEFLMKRSTLRGCETMTKRRGAGVQRKKKKKKVRQRERESAVINGVRLLDPGLHLVVGDGGGGGGGSRGGKEEGHSLTFKRKKKRKY